MGRISDEAMCLTVRCNLSVAAHVWYIALSFSSPPLGVRLELVPEALCALGQCLASPFLNNLLWTFLPLCWLKFSHSFLCEPQMRQTPVTFCRGLGIWSGMLSPPSLCL